MPRCSGCGNEFPASARFCAICGKQAIGATPTAAVGSSGSPYATGYAAPPADNSKMRVIAVAAGIILLLAVAGFALKLSGVLGAKKTETTAAAVLNAPTTQTVAAPVLQGPAVQPPTAPVIQPPVATSTPMPADVIAYLRWLKQFEAARHDLDNRAEGELRVVLAETMKNAMTGGANSGLLDGDPTESSTGSGSIQQKSAFDFHPVDAIIQQLNQATGVFQNHTPPNPCAGLATAYNGALTESVRQSSGLMSGLRSTLAKLQASDGKETADISQMVQGLQQQNNDKAGSKSIDGLYGQANANLDNVRAQYTNIPDDISASQFGIKEESSGGGGIGGMGLGM